MAVYDGKSRNIEKELFLKNLKDLVISLYLKNLLLERLKVVKDKFIAYVIIAEYTVFKFSAYF